MNPTPSIPTAKKDPVQSVTFACGHRKFYTARDLLWHSRRGVLKVEHAGGNAWTSELGCAECRKESSRVTAIAEPDGVLERDPTDEERQKLLRAGALVALAGGTLAGRLK